MKCDLIFYLAKKTALCEKKIKELFATTIYQLNSVTASTTPDSLGMQLTDALNCVNLIFVVGGLRDNDVRAISNVLSKALANSSTNIIPKRLKNEVGDFDGYILRSGKQTIICIPDNPEEIENMLNENMFNYLNRIYSE
ncbi:MULTISPECIES: hypothetical protein [Ruminococcus]|uniref:MoaB/Mog domain-containing protein n=1 Tax=Ruminococcus bovis TaxID=2564099 RepID=A0A4P8XXX2_9FIRM|nr:MULTISPECIES: hypothetical protein [Ruminococcus]MEE3440110.1 hypothetical protein [Ruminococcus sp.]QCT07029.1 hypothetical protein E5Z56_06475 [Ruminococcus bovis]